MKIFNGLLGFLLVAFSTVIAATEFDSLLESGVSKPNTDAAGVSVNRQFASQEELEAAGYTLYDMVFRGHIGPHYIEHNGTIEEIVAQVVKEHPEFDPVAYMNEMIKEENAKNAANSTTGSIDTRDAEFNRFCCPVPGQWWFDAVSSDTVQQYLWLRQGGFGNFINLPPGPGGCIRIACLGYSAILGCNDNTGPAFIAATYLAELVMDVGNMCSNENPDQSLMRTCGQSFGAYNINIIVTGWAPHC